MPVPTEELKLEIVNAATGQRLGAGSAPGTGGALVVGGPADDGARPPLWRLDPVPQADGGPPQDEPAYVLHDVAAGKVLDHPGTADAAVRHAAAAAGKQGQRWHLVPVEDAAGRYIIEAVADGAVLDLDVPESDPDTDPAAVAPETAPDGGAEAGTPVVLRPYDEDVATQQWRFVTAAPERTSDPVLRYAPLSHWNGRRSWRLAPSPVPRPVPEATPSFSDVLLVLDKYGSTQETGAAPARPLGEQPRWWPGSGARFVADTTGSGRADLVVLDPAKGVVVVPSRGDGTFGEERVLHPPAPWAGPEDVWTFADLTGDGRPDLVVLAADGVRVSSSDESGTFAAAEPVLKAFGHGAEAGGWQAARHPRFLVDTTGDGRLDLVGCHEDGVRIARQDEEGKFAPVPEGPALRAFGHAEEAGGWRAGRHPRFLADTTGDGRLDLIGCHDDGVWVALQDEDGGFAEPLYVLDAFGVEQGWTSPLEHPRFPVTTPEGELRLVGFGPQGVVVSRAGGDGTFEPARLVLNDFGTAQGWTGHRHPRFLTDVTGDGNPDLVGFGDEGVWVSHHLDDGGYEQPQLVCRGFGHHTEAGAWRTDRHPRFLADLTGEGRPDLIGFGGPGVHVARNLFRHFRTR